MKSLIFLFLFLSALPSKAQNGQNTEGPLLALGSLYEVGFQPDTALLSQYVFDLHFQNDSSVVLRTNRHLKYFNPYEQLFIEVLYIDESFKGEAYSEDDLKVLRRSETVWGIANVRIKRKGTYVIRFFSYPRVGVSQKVVEYTFLHTTKQPIDQHYISINHFERDKD
jgi:hypothetical protein